MASGSSVGKVFRPGDLAPISGVYLVSHGGGHREPHEAIVLRGETLPLCRTCKTSVAFQVVRSTSHMNHDWDFAGPNVLFADQVQLDFADLRAYPRYKIELPLIVMIGKVKIPGHTNDISEGGIAATIEARLNRQKKLVTLTLPLGKSNELTALPAELRHRNGMIHGFEFKRVKDTTRQALRLFLKDAVVA